MKTLVENTRNELVGNTYDFHANIDNPNVFIFHEVWKNKEGLDLHNEQHYLQEFVQKAEVFLEEKPIIYKTSKIG